MQLKQFLDWTIPVGHNYSATKLERTDGGGTYISHKAFTSHNELARYVRMLSVRHARDTWFALAGFKEGLVLGQDGKSRPVRKQTNVLAMRSLYVDMDVKEGGYVSKTEALSDLSAAIDAGAVPHPSIIVDSGNGIHVYWCFDEDVPIADWVPVAHGFRDAVAAAGIRFDQGITIDSARILRPPETHNHKDPASPKEVRVLASYAQHPFEGFQHYATATRSSHAGHQSVLSASGLASEFSGAADGDLGDAGAFRGEYHMEHMVPECSQLASMLAVAGEGVPEPAWKDMLLLAARCEDGEEWAHRLSSGHADYREADTTAKFLEQKAKLLGGTTGPTTCDTLNRSRPGICQTCPHKDRVKSPIVLGRPAAAVPMGFMQRPNGIYVTVADPETDQTSEVLVCNEILSDVYVLSDETEGTIIGGNWRRNRNSGRFHFPIHKISAPASRTHGIINQSGLIIRDKQVKNFQNLMFSWTEQLITRRENAAPVLAIGWNDTKTGFNYLDEQITRDGVKPIPFIAQGLRKGYGAVGTKDAWTLAVTHMLQAPIELQAIIAMSFAAPLAAFSSLDGFLFSFRSQDSGVGKSTALKMAAAIWGDPVATVFNMADTPKYILRKLGMTPNLPAFWDEVRIVNENRDFKDITKLIFELAQGQEMRRLRSDTSFQTAGQWRTLFAVATNESLLDLASGSVSTPEPVLARMLEIEVPPVVRANSPGGAAIRDLLSNYGLIGRAYIRTLMPLAPQLKAALASLTERYQSIISDGGGYRYWATATALMMLGAKLAKDGGFYPFDLQALETLLVDTMLEQASVRTEQVGIKSDDESTFRTWMLEQQPRWMVTQLSPTKGRPGNIEPLAHPDPRLGGMLFHIILDRGIARVKMTGYTEWCYDTRRPPHVFMRGLERVATRKRMAIGAGTAYSEQSVWCIEVDLEKLGMMDAVRNFLSQRGFGKGF